MPIPVVSILISILFYNKHKKQRQMDWPLILDFTVAHVDMKVLYYAVVDVPGNLS